MRVLGVIIAGGASSRMGQDKAFVIWRGKPLIEHVIERLRGQVDELVISCKSEPERFLALGYGIVLDILPIGTPLAGLHAALTYAQAHGFDAVLSAPCDGPLLPEDLRQKLIVLDHPSPVGGRWREATDEGLAASADISTPVERPSSALPGTFPQRGKGEVTLAASRGQSHYLTGFWPVSVLDAFEGLSSPRVKDFVSLVNARVVYWPDEGPDPFVNLNTPQELSDLP